MNLKKVFIDKDVSEMCRVSRSTVFNVLPSGEGDETLAKSIKYPNKSKERDDRIKKIKNILEENGFKTEERRELIEFVFPDINKLIDTIIAFYDDKPSDKELKSMKNLLISRKEKDGIHFTQGACFLITEIYPRTTHAAAGPSPGGTTRLCTGHLDHYPGPDCTTRH